MARPCRLEVIPPSHHLAEQRQKPDSGWELKEGSCISVGSLRTSEVLHCNIFMSFQRATGEHSNSFRTGGTYKEEPQTIGICGIFEIHGITRPPTPNGLKNRLRLSHGSVVTTRQPSNPLPLSSQASLDSLLHRLMGLHLRAGCHVAHVTWHLSLESKMSYN